MWLFYTCWLLNRFWSRKSRIIILKLSWLVRLLRYFTFPFVGSIVWRIHRWELIDILSIDLLSFRRWSAFWDNGRFLNDSNELFVLIFFLEIFIYILSFGVEFIIDLLVSLEIIFQHIHWNRILLLMYVFSMQQIFTVAPKMFLNN